MLWYILKLLIMLPLIGLAIWGCLKLAQWSELLELPERVDRHVLVREQFGNFGTYSLKQTALSPDVCNVDVECFGNTLFRDTALNRLQDHSMFLNHCDSIDAFVVSESLIIQ